MAVTSSKGRGLLCSGSHLCHDMPFNFLTFAPKPPMTHDSRDNSHTPPSTTTESSVPWAGVDARFLWCLLVNGCPLPTNMSISSVLSFIEKHCDFCTSRATTSHLSYDSISENLGPLRQGILSVQYFCFRTEWSWSITQCYGKHIVSPCSSCFNKP